MNENEVIEKYKINFVEFLSPIAQKLEDHIKEIFSENKRIERICSRPKSIKSFSEKVTRENDGELKYNARFSKSPISGRIREGGPWYLAECRGYKNKDAPEEVKTFVKSAIANLNEALCEGHQKSYAL